MALPDLAHDLTASPQRIALLVGVVLALVFVGYSLVEARLMRIVADEIASPNLPRELDGTRLVFVADIHAGPFFRHRSMERLVEKVNALEPDVLVLGGDYVGGRFDGAEVFYPAARGFEARLGKVAVLGNHDVWEGDDEAREGLAEAGFRVLDNESVTLESPGGGTLTVAGVEDLYTGRPDAARAAQGIDRDDFAVLVSHNPDVFASQLGSTADTWDLALAGHTHAGQVTFFGIAALFIPSSYGQRYRSGWATEHGVPILVSNGVGSVTLPLRTFARPEIHVITLRAGEPHP